MPKRRSPQTVPIESIDPEYFVFAQNTPAEFFRGLAGETESNPSEYLRGFLRAAETIIKDLGKAFALPSKPKRRVLVLGATWGLNACRVPPSLRSGVGIKVAVLDTGMDLGHPDFVRAPDRHPDLRRPASPGPPQPRHPLHRHGVRPEGAGRHHTALRHWLSRLDLRRQSAEQLGVERRRQCPCRHELGDRQPLRGDLNVPRLAVASAALVHGSGPGGA